jgi:hypothetical protein
MIIFAVMERTAMMKLIDMLDLHIGLHKENTGRFDTGAMVARNYAINLLEKEQSQLEDAYDFGAGFGEKSGVEYYKDKYGYDNEERSGLERLRILQG